MFTALTMHLLHFKSIFCCVSKRFAARFLAQASFMLISFIFSYSKKFSVVFYLSFSFVLGQDPSARDHWKLVLAQFRPDCSSGFSNRSNACVIVVVLHRYINVHYLSVRFRVVFFV